MFRPLRYWIWGLTATPSSANYLHDFSAWATTTWMARYSRSADEVPDNLSVPFRSWSGAVGGTARQGNLRMLPRDVTLIAQLLGTYVGFRPVALLPIRPPPGAA